MKCQDGRASYDVLGRYYYHGDVNLKRQYKINWEPLQKISDDLYFGPVTGKAKGKANFRSFFNGTATTRNELLKWEYCYIHSRGTKQNYPWSLHPSDYHSGGCRVGKSTIGLHRLSYLLYNGLDPQKMMVIAPNKIFLDYICELLPEIDAEDVKQYTFLGGTH